MSKLPTMPFCRKVFKSLVKESGFTQEEAFEDVVGDLLFQLRSYQKACEGWMKKCDKLKKKYEPETLELSEVQNG